MAAKLARGTRDFGPQEMAKRQHLFRTIRGVFQRYGFQPLETPALEQLDTLTGKYGEEGDKLLFKVLNSGPYWEKVPAEAWQEKSSLSPHLSEKGLRYDLTVPFARYVAMNHHALPRPFKRYQIQPVWRADRPQKGRYREFIQCDADVVGTQSLLCEAEILAMIAEVFDALGVEVVTQVNHRKLLEAIAQAAGYKEGFAAMTVAIDKLGKASEARIKQDLAEAGFTSEGIGTVWELLFLGENQWPETLQKLREKLPSAEAAIEEMADFLGKAEQLGATGKVRINPALARGLSYYTGAIFEVTAQEVSMGSICGGGRYDNLTEVFGLKEMSGVGISFGVERIYDVIEELKLWPSQESETSFLLANFGVEESEQVLPLLGQLRAAGQVAELYPENSKLKKQFSYAEKKGHRYLVMAGKEELEKGIIGLKDLKTGQQEQLAPPELLKRIQAGTALLGE